MGGNHGTYGRFTHTPGQKATPQVEAHFHQASDERATHKFAHIAASGSMLSCTDSLRAVDRSIARKRSALFSIRHVPTEILLQVFAEAVDVRQGESITSRSSYHYTEGSSHDFLALSTTLNLVPFRLSATCKRWQAICQSTPQLWRYIRVPTITSAYSRDKIVGRTQFERSVLLARTPHNLTSPYTRATMLLTEVPHTLTLHC